MFTRSPIVSDIKVQILATGLEFPSSLIPVWSQWH